MSALFVLIALAAATLSGLALGRKAFGGLSKGETFAWSLALGLMAQASMLHLLLLSRRGEWSRRHRSRWRRTAAAAAAPDSAKSEGSRIPAGKAPDRGAPAACRDSRGCGDLHGRRLSEPMWTTDYIAVWGSQGKDDLSHLVDSPEALSRSRSGLVASRIPAASSPRSGGPGRVGARLGRPGTRASVSALPGRDRGGALRFPRAAGQGCGRRRGRGSHRVARSSLRAVPRRHGGHPAALWASFCSPRRSATPSRPIRRAFALRLAIASLFCAATKAEGALFAVLAAVVWLVSRPRERPLTPTLAALLAPPLALGLLMRLCPRLCSGA